MRTGAAALLRNPQCRRRTMVAVGDVERGQRVHRPRQRRDGGFIRTGQSW